jgi:hypothetical protein
MMIYAAAAAGIVALCCCLAAGIVYRRRKKKRQQGKSRTAYGMQDRMAGLHAEAAGAASPKGGRVSLRKDNGVPKIAMPLAGDGPLGRGLGDTMFSASSPRRPGGSPNGGRLTGKPNLETSHKRANMESAR